MPYDSPRNITKRALVQALKKRMETQNFEKISISEICADCGLSRKSFYYHFKDKYELINWIYDTEFMEQALKTEFPDSWAFLEVLCAYFYENRTFYRKSFLVKGQNSFSEHFSSIVFSILYCDLSELFPQDAPLNPLAEFYADALVCSVKKWLCKKDSMAPQQFVQFLKMAVLGVSQRALRLQETVGNPSSVSQPTGAGTPPCGDKSTLTTPKTTSSCPVSAI